MGVSYQICSIQLIYDKECHISKIMGVSYQICGIQLIYDKECHIRKIMGVSYQICSIHLRYNNENSKVIQLSNYIIVYMSKVM